MVTGGTFLRVVRALRRLEAVTGWERHGRVLCALTGSQGDRRLEPSGSAPPLWFRAPQGMSLVDSSGGDCQGRT